MNRFDAITNEVCFGIRPFLFQNVGVGVPELIVEWTILAQNPELLGKIDV